MNIKELQKIQEGDPFYECDIKNLNEIVGKYAVIQDCIFKILIKIGKKSTKKCSPDDILDKSIQQELRQLVDNKRISTIEEFLNLAKSHFKEFVNVIKKANNLYNVYRECNLDDFCGMITVLNNSIWPSERQLSLLVTLAGGNSTEIKYIAYRD